jgi:ABC-2 type transport system ATP-binding protein
MFLDEPTTGFDPGARRDAWEIVRNLRAIGKSVLLTTHYMDEAEHLADRVAIIARGRLIAEGHPRELARERTVVRFRPDGAMPPLYDGVSTVAGEEGWVEIEAPDATRLLHALTSWAVARNTQLHGLTVRQESLEDAYLRLVREDADA